MSGLQRRKAPSNYSMDRAWAGKWLAQGEMVWCIRHKRTGLVQFFTAGDISTWNDCDGKPLSEFNVQQMVMRDGVAWFGPECAWPKGDKP